MSEADIQVEMPRTNAPQPFGKYLLQERIGSGGMAEVFRAIAVGPEGFQRSVVIKRILPHLSQDASFVRMFIDEAKISGLLSHPNLVQIFEFGKVDHSFFIAMEHVHGRTLSSLQMRLVELDRLPTVAASAEIGRQICAGLEYAHGLTSVDGRALGIVHRDISPSNVMLAFHGGVKILDFGIARVADGLRQFRTQVGALKGKVSYMSPEQIQLDEIDHRSDIFAVGIVLHELLTRRRLFRGSSEFTASRKVLELEIPLPSSLNPQVPRALDRVVMRALARDRDARYASAGEMCRDLDRLMQDLHMSPREHVALLNEIFPDHATPITDAANLFGVTTPLPGRPPPLVATAGERSTLGLERSRSDGNIASWDPGATPHPSRPGSPHALDPAGPPTRRPGGRAVAASLAGWRGRFSSRWRAVTGAGVVLLAFGVWWVWPARKVAEGAAPLGAAERRVTAPIAPAPRAVVQCSFDSSPQDAAVTRVGAGVGGSGVVLGRTPFTVSLPRSDEVIVFRFEKPGHASALYKVIPDLDKAVRVDLAPDGNHAKGSTLAGAARKPNHRDSVRRVSKSVRDATPIDPFTM